MRAGSQVVLCVVVGWVSGSSDARAQEELEPGAGRVAPHQEPQTGAEPTRSPADWGTGYGELVEEMHGKTAEIDPRVDLAFSSAGDVLRAMSEPGDGDVLDLAMEFQELVARSMSDPGGLEPGEVDRLNEFARVIDAEVVPALRVVVEGAPLNPPAGETLGFDLKFVGSSTGRTLGLVLAARARQAIQQEDMGAALKSIASALACARYVERWPSTVTRRLALQVRASTVRSALDGVHRYQMNASQVRSILDLLEQQPLHASRFAADAEWMLQRAELDRIHAELAASGGAVNPEEREAEINRMGRFRDFLAEMIDPETTAVRRDTLGQRINKSARDEIELNKTPVFWSLLPPVGKIVRQEVDLRTAEDALYAAWGLYQFRERAGQWPSSMFELGLWTSRLPMDHYWGLPMRYNVVDPEAPALGQGVVLYSVGKDLEDDGGDPERDEVFLGGY